MKVMPGGTRLPGAPQDRAHEQEQRHRDEDEARGRVPHRLAEKGPERAVREGESGDEAEHPERRPNIDAGAEEGDEQGDEEQQLGDRQAAAAAAEKTEADGEADEDEEEGDGDHGASIPVFAPIASRASAASSS